MKCEYPKWICMLCHGEFATATILFCLTIAYAAIKAESWYFIFIIDEAFASVTMVKGTPLVDLKVEERFLCEYIINQAFRVFFFQYLG